MGRAAAVLLFSAWITATALCVQTAPCNFQWQAPDRQYANEGGQFTVDCSFTANYHPINDFYVITWVNPLGHDLALLLNNGSVIDSGAVDHWNRAYTFIRPATVRITAATAADAGNYTCRVNIILGCNYSNIPDKQVELVLRVPPSKSVITRHQSTGFTVREGDSPKLKCMSATGTPPLTYTWSRGSTSLTGTPDSANTFSILTIPSIQRTQQGPYQCSVQNAAGSNTADDVTMNVLYPPVASANSSVLSGTVGNSIPLQCTVSTPGNPSSTNFTWSTDTSVTLPSSSSGTLKLTRLTLSHEGIYRCTPVNSAGQGTSATITLTVSKYPVITTLQNVTVNVSDALSVDCRVEAKPKANVQWKFNHGALPDIFATNPVESTSGRVHITTQRLTWSTGSTLKQRKGGKGLLTCSASNNVAIIPGVTGAIDYLYLDVLYPPGPAAATPVTITKTTGQSVTFQCSVNSVGNPSTTTWQWSTDTSITLPSSSTSLLTLTGLTVSHDGKYYCTPSNSAGAGTRAEMTLIVNKPPVISPAVPDQSASVLSQFFIDCRVEAKPKATVEWKFNNGALPDVFTSTTVEFSSENIYVTTVTLTWSSSSTRDQRKAGAGVLTCRATNTAVTSPVTDTLNLDVQYPPGKATVDGGQSNTTVIAVEGQPHTLNCEFTDKGNPQATSFDWYVHGSTDSSRQAASYQISQPALSDSGTYQCRPYNTIGRGDPATITLNVHAPGQIQTKPQNLTVNESDVSVQLTCGARGKPVPTVTWTHGDQDVSSQLYTVQNTPQLNGVTQYDTVTSILTLAGPDRTGDKVTRTDHGCYSCTASNGVGTSTVSSAYINVQYRAEVHPTKVTVRKVATDLSSEGLFTLYVVGNPKPSSYTWMRVNGILPVNATPGHDIDNQESTLRVPNLRDEDYGNYTCVVKNAAGERGFMFILERRGKPDPPTGLSNLTISAISVTVQWTSNKNGGYEQTFTVQYKSPGEDWESIPNIEDPGYKQRRSYKVQNLQNDTQYTFRVESRNKDGSGGYSDVLPVQTKSKPVITEASLSVVVKGNIATVKWPLPEGEFTSYGIQYCLRGTTQCDIHTITNVTTTSADITLPDGSGQYELHLIVYQEDDAVATSHFIRKVPTAQDSFPVGLVVGVLATAVIVAVTGAFVFLYIRRKIQQHSDLNRNDEKNMGNTANELSIIDSRKDDGLYEKPNQADENKSTYATLKPGNDVINEESTYADIQERDFEVPRQNIKVLEKIGSGAFVQVFLGKLFNHNDRKHWATVAVKTIEDDEDSDALKDLKNELKMMKTLGPHPNVIQLLASCTKDSGLPLIILEYLPNGNLQDFLRKDRSLSKTTYGNLHGISSSLTSRDLIKFASDVASGMVYLSSMKILHRDLAARNVLLADDMTCKISDFGFAKDVIESNKYEKKSQGRRWMSPEACFDSIFTTQSDVWAYGVLLWEIVTLGSSPYPGMSAKQVMEAISEGYRMPQPPHCSQEMYTIMLSCWKEVPSSRLTFKEIVISLDVLLASDSEVLTMGKFEENLYEDIDKCKVEEKC